MAIKGNKSELDLIRELAKIIKESDLSEIEMEQSNKNSETIYVRVSKGNDNMVATSSHPQTVTPNNQNSYNGVPEQTEAPASPNLENHPGILQSPMVGTVYLAPEPEAEPFVKIGDNVTVGQTILIVEAMKTLNQIPANQDGIIKRILVEDGTPVEFGSPLVIIE